MQEHEILLRPGEELSVLQGLRELPDPRALQSVQVKGLVQLNGVLVLRDRSDYRIFWRLGVRSVQFVIPEAR